MTVPQAWVLVKSLKQEIQQHSARLSAGRFDSVPFLSAFNQIQKDSFLAIINALLFNMEMRFPCPSLSLDKRVANRHKNPEKGQLERRIISNTQQKCPINVVVGLFLFPDDWIKNRQINPFSSAVNSLKSPTLPVK